ncbi:MAG: DUF362 domain-containing protein [Planctomycetota bacterium]|jgi:uncharacterized protein (DUF362 family)
MNQQENENIGRRELLARTGKAGLSIAAAGIASYWLYDAAGPAAGLEETGVTVPNFSISPIDGQTIGIVKGHDRAATVNKAIELLGGIERFVKPGDTVVIKPNVAFASPPILGATARPELVAEVARLCYSRGRAKKVYVADNPINDPASCFMLSGIGKAASQAGAEVMMPRDNLFRRTTLAGGELIKNWPIFFAPLEKADKLIGIAPVKHHLRSGASMTMKNWYGLLGGRRNIFHQDINTIIAELAMMVKPTLVILDGIESMMTNGPTGGSVSDLKRTNTLIASTDCVAADSCGCALLGLKVSDLPYLSKAQNAGAGTSDYQSLRPRLATVS